MMHSAQNDNLEQSLRILLENWAGAELQGDVSFLGNALANDFVAIGPLGFMLSKEDWLQRHGSGDLKYTAFNMSDLNIRFYGDAAIVTSRQTQKGNYKG